MGNVAKDINKITGTIIGLSGKLILYALVVLLLAEGMSRGYAFGYDIFYARAMEEAPGRDESITIPKDQKSSDTIRQLKDQGLIDDELAVKIQMKFYEYKIHPGTYTLNTSMTSKEILQVLNETDDSQSFQGQTEENEDLDEDAAAEIQIDILEGGAMQ